MSRTLIQAHRGASAYAPENTLPAFRLAVDMHADGIECDIHMTRDGHFIVCHDDSVDRTSNGKGDIGTLTLAEIKALDFGSKYNLTGFDMTTYDQDNRLTVWLLGEYLFAIPKLIGQFPFVSALDTLNGERWGWAPNEPFYAGYLWLKPIVLVVATLPSFEHELRRRRLGAFCILSAVLMCVVLFVDTNVAGITERYFSDFGIYVAILGTLSIFLVAARLRERPAVRNAWGIVAALSLAFSLAVALWLPMDPGRYHSYEEANPALYEEVKAHFE